MVRSSRAAWEAWLEDGSRQDISAAVDGLTVPTLVAIGAEEAALIWLTAASPLLYGFGWTNDRGAAEAVVFLPFLLILGAELLAGHGRVRASEYCHVSRVGHQPAA